MGLAVKLRVVNAAVVGWEQLCLAHGAFEACFVKCLFPSSSQLTMTSHDNHDKRTLLAAPTNSIGYTVFVQIKHFCCAFCLQTKRNDVLKQLTSTGELLQRAGLEALGLGPVTRLEGGLLPPFDDNT